MTEILSGQLSDCAVTETEQATLPVGRLRLTVRVEAALQLPRFAGSLLRGAFGHALLALSPLRHVDDQPCALRTNCPYCQIFAAAPLSGHSLQKFSRMPQPYVIEPPSGGAQHLHAGQTFDFDFVLIGGALKFLPVVQQAWELALRTGLGQERARCSLLNISDLEDSDALSIHREVRSISAHRPASALFSSRKVALRFHTPLRLQVQGRPARAGQLTARSLLITLARRHQLLCDIHLGATAPQHDFARLIASVDAIELDAQSLRWFDWGRYSQRQHQEMKLGGLLGEITLRGDLAPFAALLHLGQWLHVGKNATFGMGGYSLD